MHSLSCFLNVARRECSRLIVKISPILPLLLAPQIPIFVVHHPLYRHADQTRTSPHAQHHAG